MASSSAHQHLPNIHPATSAPPPTPSTQPSNITSSSASEAADALSSLLHRLPPTLSLSLSLPTRRSPPPTTSPPTICLSDDPTSTDLTQLGFFQLTSHHIPPQLAKAAAFESLSLFDLTTPQKQSYFPKNWPLGYDNEDGSGESFWLHSESKLELELGSLTELSRELGRVGLEVIEMVSRAVRFDIPDPTRIRRLMVVHEDSGDNKCGVSGGSYPYVIALQYQIRRQKYSLLSDSGWVDVLPEVDSVLVTIGDIAQVWSNGKLKKVRGRPLVCMEDGNNTRCISMTLLMTLSMESTVSPLLPKQENADEIEVKKEDDDEETHSNKEKVIFSSFSFEDYAWRVYHEPLLFKDPLDKYRISS